MKKSSPFFLLICTLLLCINLVSPAVDAREALDAPKGGDVVVQMDFVGADSPSEFIVEVAHPDFDHGLPAISQMASLLVLPNAGVAQAPVNPRFRPPGELYRPPALI